jgi:hypothetical protein
VLTEAASLEFDVCAVERDIFTSKNKTTANILRGIEKRNFIMMDGWRIALVS